MFYIKVKWAGVLASSLFSQIPGNTQKIIYFFPAKNGYSKLLYHTFSPSSRLVLKSGKKEGNIAQKNQTIPKWHPQEPDRPSAPSMYHCLVLSLLNSPVQESGELKLRRGFALQPCWNVELRR